MPQAHHYWMGLALFTGMALALAVSAQEATNLSTRPATLVARPYSPVSLTMPAAPEDPELAAFRRRVAEVANRRVYRELAALVIDAGFFWDGDFASRYDPLRAPVDNLAAALQLESHNGSGWEWLAAFAGEPAHAAIPSRMGSICAPGQPRFDEIEFGRLIETTGTNPAEWRYPRKDAVPVHAGPSADARQIATLTLSFVRVLGDPDRDPAADFIGDNWVRVATPEGTRGFVARRALLSLSAARLCYGKDATGRWRISGFVAAEN